MTSNQLYPISDLQGKVDGSGTWREQGADAYGMVEIMLSYQPSADVEAKAKN